MSDRKYIAQALLDAIGWQAGLADAWPKGSDERQEAIDQIKAYRRILKRRYGNDHTQLDAMLKKAKLVPALALRKD
jgi:hypothetical protein